MSLSAGPAGDKAGQEYWEHIWQRGKLPEPFQPHSRNIWQYADVAFHSQYQRALAGLPQGSRLLEIGCGRSRLLPYFAAHYGFEVTGLDYSETGCEQARAMLRATGVKGTIVRADLREPPPDMLGCFDVVSSSGVVEHFTDVASSIDSKRRFLKDSGLMLTSVPNFAGLLGVIQRLLDRQVFDAHNPIDRDELIEAHSAAGMDVQWCTYVMVTNWGVPNVASWSNKRAVRLIQALQMVLMLGSWALERAIPRLPPNALTSPYIFCVSRNSGSDREDR